MAGDDVTVDAESVLAVKHLLQTAVIVSDARKVRSVVAIGQVLHGEVDRTSLRLADAGGLLQGNLSIVNATVGRKLGVPTVLEHREDLDAGVAQGVRPLPREPLPCLPRIIAAKGRYAFIPQERYTVGCIAVGEGMEAAHEAGGAR